MEVVLSSRLGDSHRASEDGSFSRVSRMFSAELLLLAVCHGTLNALVRGMWPLQTRNGASLTFISSAAANHTRVPDAAQRDHPPQDTSPRLG